MTRLIHLPYSIYLLRLWLDVEGETDWRFSLEDPRTGARRGFATLDDLAAFLQQETTGIADRARYDDDNHPEKGDLTER